MTLDVRQTFATDDGAFIQVFETGSSQQDVPAHVRLAFETGSQKYYWLNSVVGVCILRLGEGGQLTIDAWQVCCDHCTSVWVLGRWLTLYLADISLTLTLARNQSVTRWTSWKSRLARHLLTETVLRNHFSKRTLLAKAHEKF